MSTICTNDPLTSEHNQLATTTEMYYNKWYVAGEEIFPFPQDPSRDKVLVRLMKNSGSSYHEVKLDTDGDWGPKQVFCTKKLSEILKVESELVEL